MNLGSCRIFYWIKIDHRWAVGTLTQNFSFVNHHSAIELVSFVNGNSIRVLILAEILSSANSINLIFQVYICTRYFVVTAYNKAYQTGIRSYESRKLLYAMLYGAVITNSTYCWQGHRQKKIPGGQQKNQGRKRAPLSLPLFYQYRV